MDSICGGVALDGGHQHVGTEIKVVKGFQLAGLGRIAAEIVFLQHSPSVPIRVIGIRRVSKGSFPGFKTLDVGSAWGSPFGDAGTPVFWERGVRGGKWVG